MAVSVFTILIRPGRSAPAALLAAVLHLVPDLRPFLSPRERPPARSAGFLGEVRLVVGHGDQLKGAELVTGMLVLIKSMEWTER